MKTRKQIEDYLAKTNADMNTFLSEIKDKGIEWSETQKTYNTEPNDSIYFGQTHRERFIELSERKNLLIWFLSK